MFCKEETFHRAKDHAVASVCSIGRHTITNLIIWLGRDQADHTADYRLYNEYKWNVEDLFTPLVNQSLQFFDNEYIVVGADDTRCRKTGKKIPGTFWGRDPLSPPFQVNLLWGLRFLQFSCLLPLYNRSSVGPRAIPIRFVHTPPVARPGKRATDEQIQTYKRLIKTHNLSTSFVNEVEKLRKHLDESGCSKKLLMVVDGSFCNKICMNLGIANVEIIARARKDAKLCFPDTTSKRKRYSANKFTPEDVRQDNSIPWKSAKLFYGGEWRMLRYKEVNNVLWQSGTKTKKLRLFVVAPLPYVKAGIRSYRQPAYLLSTDTHASAEFLLQSYLDRWQIEVNFREEKSILGVGEAQVWNEKSVQRQPAFRVAAYSALLLASVLAYQDLPQEGERPKWRDPPTRITCRALVGIMRAALLDDIEAVFDLGLTRPMVSAIFKKAA
jgi:hypothetical protein